jgi:hypothetical protein
LKQAVDHVPNFFANLVCRKMKLGVLTIRYEGTQKLDLSGSSPDVYLGFTWLKSRPGYQLS